MPHAPSSLIFVTNHRVGIAEISTVLSLYILHGSKKNGSGEINKFIKKGNDNARHCEGEAWRHPEGDTLDCFTVFAMTGTY
jgi:hypothetical protein